MNHLDVAAADLDGLTGRGYGEDATYEGIPLYPVDDLLDRDELAVMLWAEHRMGAGFASTATADSTIMAATEISSSPEVSGALDPISGGEKEVDSQEGDFVIFTQVDKAITGDLVGRVLAAMGFGPITDGAGPGGAGTEGTDWWEGQPAAVPTFDPRDTLYMNGAIDISNAADLSAHVDVRGRHVYGVLEDFFD